MGLFKALRTVLRIASKAGKVAAEVSPVVEVADIAVNAVGETLKPKKDKTNGR